jgi:FixJ family two-component response regulator
MVLLDLELPGINGIETLKQLKHLSLGVAVIIVTGHGNIETAVETMKLGAHDFITKPFNLEELIALVKQASAIHGCMASCQVDIDDCRTRSGG